MSLSELAGRVGLGRMALSNIESAHRKIALSEACDLAEALGVPLLDMLSPAPLVITERIRLD